MVRNIPPFFVLERTAEAPEVIDARFKYVTCDKCGERPVARVGDTSVRFTHKDQLMDIARTAGGLLVRQSVIEHLTTHLITGWRAGAVRAEAVPRLCSPNLTYSELIAIGHTRGYAEGAKLEVDSTCPTCGRQAYLIPQEGLQVPADCWDGSDVFVIDELPGLFLVTDAVREILERYRHTGAICTPIADWRDSLGWLQEKRLAQPPPSVWPPCR